jgi:hypothetical protein
MGFDIDAKIQELKNRLAEIESEKELPNEPKWWKLLRKMFVESEVKQLEAIKNKRFHVTINLEIHCETFGTKDFPVAEFDLTDDFTVECAVRDYRRCEDGKKTSNFI